ncbi:MAG TPA: M28 family metallopeptidase [Solirubrobacter sp.]|nr:M28 family metallopeptidase [Solirubrobacter sp.]
MLAAGLCALALAACGGGSGDDEPSAAAPAPAESAALKVDRFDEDRAWRTLEYQVKLGSRPAGSEKARELAEYIRKRLPRGRFENLPGGLRNVVGEIRGKGKPIVLAAHYDTKDIEGFVGANDGAGGTAALLEIARVLRKTKRPAGAPPIRFVAFDGEEATDDNDFYGTGLRGSKPYARQHAKNIRELVLMDFIADKDLSIPREASSNERMWADLRRAARRVGAAAAFPDETQGTVLDDHTPFIRRGVPSIDLIDFDFPCWHETCDDLTAVSKASLDKSGETVLEFLRTRR